MFLLQESVCSQYSEIACVIQLSSVAAHSIVSIVRRRCVERSSGGGDLGAGGTPLQGQGAPRPTSTQRSVLPQKTSADHSPRQGLSLSIAGRPSQPRRQTLDSWATSFNPSLTLTVTLPIFFAQELHGVLRIFLKFFVSFYYVSNLRIPASKGLFAFAVVLSDLLSTPLPLF